MRTPEEIAYEELGSLLAIIHGDGGHYQEEHGTEKATGDAARKWYGLRQRAEAAERERDAERSRSRRLAAECRAWRDERRDRKATADNIDGRRALWIESKRRLAAARSAVDEFNDLQETP